MGKPAVQVNVVCVPGCVCVWGGARMYVMSIYVIASSYPQAPLSEGICVCV